MRNSLKEINPVLALEWHPTRNGELSPEDVLPNSNKKVWWLYPYDDPDTGKHYEFEWEARINNRNRGIGCPFLSGRKVLKGFNDLKTKNPDLAAEWHPTKNGTLTPEDVTSHHGKKVWWLYPYDDPDTGKHYDFEWQAKISNRIQKKGCPFLSGRKVWKGFNDLKTRNPKLAAEWHPTRNGTLTPEDVSLHSREKVWWLYAYDDPDSGKHFEFEWKATVSNRVNGDGCPFLGWRAVWKGFNDLKTKNPKLASEWHPTKNGDLGPEDVLESSVKPVWWIYPYDDPETGKHYDFEWRTSVRNRTEGSNCPYISGQSVWKGFNDLKTKNPELAAEWHPTKNGSLTPEDVTASSNRYVWWLYPYDDLETGKHYDFEWKTQINSRNQGSQCPYISGQAVWKGYNDLCTRNPELALEWNLEKNHGKKPETVNAFSTKKYWWICKKSHVWRQSVYLRMKGTPCPYCKKEQEQGE